MKRTAISKRVRFEIFKRDNFTCQYCSAKPPHVPLEVDHILPVSKGGGNEDENLITACFDCNRGKSNGLIELSILHTSDKIEQMKLAQDQYKQFLRVVKAKNRIIESDVDAVEKVYNSFFENWEFNPRFRISVKTFIKNLGVETVVEAMEKSCIKIGDPNAVIKYFCGICWIKIREGKNE